MSNNYAGATTAMGASYPYSKEELSSMMDGLTKEVNSVAIKSGIDPGKWAVATTDAWKEMYPSVSSNVVVIHGGYGSFESAAQESLRRLKEKHGYKKTLGIKVPITMKPKANQSVQPVQQETAQAETKLETTDTPDGNLGSSSEDAGIVNVPELETGKEPLSERDEAERIIRKLCLERGGIPPMSDLMSATGRGNKTLKDWFYPSWEWPERFGVDWSSELQRTKAKAAKEKAAAEEAAAAAAASNIEEEVEEIEPIEEELPVEEIVDDKPEEPDDEESEEHDAESEDDEESDEESEDDEESEGSDEEPEGDEESEDDEESEESEEEQDFNEATHYTVPPGFSGEISFKFENKSDEELDIWLYFSKFLEVELDVKMSGKRVFSTTSDDG